MEHGKALGVWGGVFLGWMGLYAMMGIDAATAADSIGIAADAQQLKVGFTALVAVAVVILLMWRGVGILGGHVREIAEVFATVTAGLVLIVVLPNWAAAKIAAGATPNMLPMASQAISDLASFGLIVVPQLALGMRVWLAVRRRCDG